MFRRWVRVSHGSLQPHFGAAQFLLDSPSALANGASSR
jgi:hypothetical protein